MSNLKNFKESCERNKDPILERLAVEFSNSTTVLEIGSGSGQHALYFGEHLPHLSWQTTELHTHVPELRDNLRTRSLPNTPHPIVMDVSQHPWPIEPVSAVFSANTLHIMAWNLVEDFFEGVGRALQSNGRLCIYGPFRYHNDYTSESNAKFDRWLKERDPQSGIRDFEAINMLARRQKLVLFADHQMPSNNQLLVWHKT